MKYGLCLKFKRKYDEVRGRGSNVDSVIISGSSFNIWIFRCRRLERVAMGVGFFIRSRGFGNV